MMYLVCYYNVIFFRPIYLKYNKLISQMKFLFNDWAAFIGTISRGFRIDSAE
jgi:hypothetical protein